MLLSFSKLKIFSAFFVLFGTDEAFKSIIEELFASGSDTL